MKWLVLFTSIVTAVVGAGQIVIAPTSLELRIAQASTVCVCTLTSSGATGIRYDLVVIRGYKNAGKGQVLHANSRTEHGELAEETRYLLFTGQQLGSGVWPITGVVPVPDDFPDSPSAEEPASLEPDIDEYVQRNYQKVTGSKVEVGIRFLDQFDSLSPQSISIFEHLAAGKENTVALLSASSLLKRGIDGPTLFADYLKRLEIAPAREIPFTGSAEFIFTQNARQSEIGDFENLSHSESTEIRHAALLALKKVADESTTGFLIKELDAPDPYDEYLALSTLAKLYGKTGEYGPGIGDFEKDRGRYVLLWKTWFRTSAN